MRPGGSKAKGGTFERLICVKLSKWLTNGEKEDCLWRSAMSGGRATVGRRRGVDLDSQSGDLSAISPEGHWLTDKFSIECKSYANIHISSLIFGTKGGIIEFWKQCKRDAALATRLPMLIAKQNRQDVLLCINAEGLAAFEIDRESKLILAHFREQDIYLIWFEAFLLNVRSSVLHAPVERKILQRK